MLAVAKKQDLPPEQPKVPVNVIVGKVDYSGVMKRNWAGWIVGLIFLATLALTVYEYVQGVAAFHSGQSPLAAGQATQQRVFHIMANPWVFAAYFVLLVALLVQVVSLNNCPPGSIADHTPMTIDLPFREPPQLSGKAKTR
jgi:hypothetical protein